MRVLFTTEHRAAEFCGNEHGSTKSNFWSSFERNLRAFVAEEKTSAEILIAEMAPG